MEARCELQKVEQDVSTASHLEACPEYVRQLSFFGSDSPEPSEEGLEVQNVLGPPLEFLPKDIEPNELDAYRADYQAFRAGNATGARGEMASLCASVRERKLLESCSNSGSYYKTWKKRRPRLVPLIGLDLATSSAVLSAASAADEHLEAMAQIHQAISGKFHPETSEDSGYEPHLSQGPYVVAISTPPTARGVEGRRMSKETGKSEMKLRPSKMDKGKFPRQSSAPSGADVAALKRAWATLRPPGPIAVAPPPPVQEAKDLEADWPEDGFVSPPWERATTSSPVIAQTGIGFFTHIAVSLLCLVPFLNVRSTTHRCLFLPSMYAAYVTGMCLKIALFPPDSAERPLRFISKVLRMETWLSSG